MLANGEGPNLILPKFAHILFTFFSHQLFFSCFPFTKWQDNRNSSSGLSEGWPRLLNRGDRLTEVKITVIKGSNFRDFDNWPLNTGPLNTSSTELLWILYLVQLLKNSPNLYWTNHNLWKQMRRICICRWINSLHVSRIPLNTAP